MFRNKLMFGFVAGNLALVSSAMAIPDPSHVFCLEMGYVVEDGYCVFPDGSSCELWAFLLGECGEEYVHPVPCAEAGEHRGVAVTCCEGLVEISNAYPEDHVCHHLYGAFALCSACGDESCDDWENPCNCPEDCPCVGEGGSIPVVLDPPVCCMGLELIPPMYPDWFGIYGYCTANCGDGVCDPEIETDYNCPEDCPCVGEGGSIPVIPDPPVCCTGLELIPPMSPDWFGIYGYCTANCGDGVCDPEIETDYNCPEDCPCVEEGGTMPVVPFPPPLCCPGLELIPPMCPGWLGIFGYCTANCGDGVCDPEIETDYNCPEDCPAGSAMTYCFSGCGELASGPQDCTMFHADSGESLAVGNTGRFWIGDHVYVAGLVVEDSPMCWSANVPVIEDNAISACFTGCGVIDWRGPQGCTLFHADGERTFTLDNWGGGDFTHGDRVYVTGAIHEDSMACWPVTIPTIKDNTIAACFAGCGEVDWHGPQGCALFHADNGQSYTLDNWGDFTHGDWVYVTGEINEHSIACWPVTMPAVEDNTISACVTREKAPGPSILFQTTQESELQRMTGDR